MALGLFPKETLEKSVKAKPAPVLYGSGSLSFLSPAFYTFRQVICFVLSCWTLVNIPEFGACTKEKEISMWGKHISFPSFPPPQSLYHHHVGVNGCMDFVLQWSPAPDATLNQPITSSAMHQGDTVMSSFLPLLIYGMDYLCDLLHCTATKPAAIAGSWLALFCTRPVGRVGLYFLHWCEGKGARLGMHSTSRLGLFYSFPCGGTFSQDVLWQALNQFVVPLFMMKLVHLFYVNSPWDCLLWHRDPCAFGDAKNLATGSLFSLVCCICKTDGGGDNVCVGRL